MLVQQLLRFKEGLLETVAVDGLLDLVQPEGKKHLLVNLPA